MRAAPSMKIRRQIRLLNHKCACRVRQLHRYRRRFLVAFLALCAGDRRSGVLRRPPRGPRHAPWFARDRANQVRRYGMRQSSSAMACRLTLEQAGFSAACYTCIAPLSGGGQSSFSCRARMSSALRAISSGNGAVLRTPRSANAFMHSKIAASLPRVTFTMNIR